MTSQVFERALRYRQSYDPAKGSPAAWLVGIARRCIDDHLRTQALEVRSAAAEVLEGEHESDPAEATDLRLDVAAAVAHLGLRDRELIAMRYGGDLKVKDIAVLLGERPNTVEVALHRALGRLRFILEDASHTSVGSATVDLLPVQPRDDLQP